jgi:hypothetical protein
MTHAQTTPQEDLAFLRGIAQGGPGQFAGGSMFFATGLIYAAQSLGHWAQATGLVQLGLVATVALAAGPTVLFLIIVVLLLSRSRAVPGGGPATRAVNGAFAAAALANLALAAVFALNAWRRQDWLIWEFYPAVVFALHGASWLLAYMVDRRAWRLWTGLGALVCAVVLGALIGTSAYILAVAVGLLLFMALPGWIMMRLARRVA